MNLSELKGWVFDLDGVIWAGETEMPGAVALIAALRGAGRQVLFLSNNSAGTPHQLAARLTAFGIPTTLDEVVSPISAAGAYLTERYGSVKVLVSGIPELGEVLAEAGHTPVVDPEQAEAVVMGRDFGFGFEQLTRLCRAVDRGVPFLTLNNDPRMPVEGGWIPGLGAMVAAVVAATGREPEVVGKPNPPLFDLALGRLGLAPAEAVMIGDTPAADIAGGLRAGMWTVQMGGAPSEPRAHLHVQTPAELLALWKSET